MPGPAGRAVGRVVLPGARKNAPAMWAADHALDVQVVGQSPNPRINFRVSPLVVRYAFRRTTRLA